MAALHDDSLHDLAGASLRDGRLPATRPERILGGRGTGSPCDLCAQALELTEPELELEFAAPVGGASRCLHLHVGCFAAWDRAREAL